MPSALTAPGVYIEEIPSGVRPIIGVSTSTTAFVGRTRWGPVDEATVINGLGDFDRKFGGLWSESRLGFAVRDFFRNGGSQAVIVRVFDPTGLVRTDAEIAESKAGALQVHDAVKGAADVAAAKQAASSFPDPGGATSATKAGIAAAKAAVAKAGADPNADQAALVAAAKKIADNGASRPIAQVKVGTLSLTARQPGAWGAGLRSTIDRDLSADAKKDEDTFNLVVTDTVGGTTETFARVTFGDGPRKLADVMRLDSSLVTLDDSSAAPNLEEPWAKVTSLSDEITKKLAAGEEGKNEIKALRDYVAPWADDVTIAERVQRAVGQAARSASQAPTAGPADVKKAIDAATKAAQDAVDAAEADRAATVADGAAPTAGVITPASGEADFTGIYALAKTDIFNLLVIPPYRDFDDGQGGDVDSDVIGTAAAFCETHRAMLIVDPPKAWNTKDKVTAGLAAGTDLGTTSRNAALFFPRVKQQNPLNELRVETFTPSGVVAGVMARTDVERGVWKAPAGLDASLVGVRELAVNLTHGENGELNPRGVNCLRLIPPGRKVIWGSRTLEGDDRLASEWKYIPVRRTALYIEESLYRGTQWVVFEPNDEPLWASIRLNVGAFMNGLFRQGAFQGRTPREAYFVRCDKDTNPQADIDRGIVNILVGFAPLKPAEFVVIKLQQIAGQVEV